jgi:hypothetical protein
LNALRYAGPRLDDRCPEADMHPLVAGTYSAEHAGTPGIDPARTRNGTGHASLEAVRFVPPQVDCERRTCLEAIVQTPARSKSDGYSDSQWKGNRMAITHSDENSRDGKSDRGPREEKQG